MIPTDSSMRRKGRLAVQEESMYEIHDLEGSVISKVGLVKIENQHQCNKSDIRRQVFCRYETEKKAIRRSSRREEYDPEGLTVSQVGGVGSSDPSQLNLTNIGFEGESRCTTPIASYQLGDHCTVTILQGRLVDVTSECVVRCTTTKNIPLENDSLPGVAECTREDRPDAEDGRLDRLRVYHNRDQPRLTVVVPFNDSGQIIYPGNKHRVYEDYLLYFRQVLNLVMKLSVESVAIQVPTWYRDTEWRTQVTSALCEAIARRAHRFRATMRVLILHPEKGTVQEQTREWRSFVVVI